MVESFKYVIIGNGAAGLSALESIRRVDRVSPAAIISHETELAYSRTLLPYYVEGRIDGSKVFIRDADYYTLMNARPMLGNVTGVDFGAKSVKLGGKREIGYEKLLIATGAVPLLPPIKGLKRKNIFTLWTLEDARKLISAAPDAREVAIIGAGLIGVQSSHALANRNVRFTLIDIADHILPRILDAEGASLVQKKVEGDRVRIITSAAVTEIARGRKGHAHSIKMEGRDSVDADLVIVGTGARPNVSFLAKNGISMGAGILVNNKMETNIPDVYAAGDAAQGHDAISGEQIVRGIWTTAVEQGSAAGYNMAGRVMNYEGSLSVNVVDFFGVTVASVGETGATDGYEVETFTDRPGTTYRKLFIKDGVVRGAVFVGQYRDAGIMQWLVRMKADIRVWKGTLAGQPLNMGKVILGINQVDLGPHWPLPPKL